MDKRILFVLILSCLLFLSACSDNDTDSSSHLQMGSSVNSQETNVHKAATISGGNASTVTDEAVASRALEKAVAYLVSVQHDEGFWMGSFETDSSFTADYIILMHYLKRVDTLRQAKAVRHILSDQNSDGGWSVYQNGPSYLDISVTNYLALKLRGMSSSHPGLVRAREFILAKGGAERANLLVQIKLSLFGQVPWSRSIPVNTNYLFAENAIYRLGYMHTAIIPILVLHENYHKVEIPEKLGVREIFLKDPWKGVTELPPRKGLRQQWAIRWMMERQEADGNWAGVFVNTMFCLLALESTQNSAYNPVIDKGMEGVRLFQNETETLLSQQFSIPPVMDTAYVVHALLAAGIDPESPVIMDAIGYLRSKQSLIYADWHHNNPDGEPGGWGFEHHNQWFPDVDCTVMALDALASFDALAGASFEEDEAVQRGQDWVVSMQSLDGGWAAWDKNPFSPPDWIVRLMNQAWIPWDESYEDITSRCLLTLSNMGYRDPEVIHPALHFIRRRQKVEGCWYGRWGINYTYGTGQVLQGLVAAGENPQDGYIRKAVAWLVGVQNEDGGWGESPESYVKGSFVPAPSTIFQSAYVIIGLISAGEADTPEVERGIAFLVNSQLPDGSWYDEEYLGTAFPNYVYSRYTLLSTYKALYALILYLNNK